MKRLKEKLGAARASGLSLLTLNGVMVALAIVLSLALLFAILQTQRSFRRLQQTTDLYITCERDAMLFQQGSDYLTGEVRSFAVTGEARHVFNYIEELEVTRRRERTRDDAGFFELEADSLRYLDEGLAESNALVDVECYSMRLMIQALGDDPAAYPDRVATVVLKEEDLLLSAEAQREKALIMLFDDAYATSKTAICDSVDNSIDLLIQEARHQMLTDTASFNSALHRQEALVAAMLLALVAFVVCHAVLVVTPLRRNVRHVDNGEAMPVDGAREMRHLAQIYNQLLSENQEKHDALSYTATHDALTGLYNRAAYEAAYKRLRGQDIGVLIVDLDHFKQVNDTCGHDIGDRALKRLAEVLKQSFRSEDHISRIGGDEFCVIMKNAGSALQDLVRQKVARMNEVLSLGTDGLPPLSVSVGVAFADRENPTDEIFKDADTALYRVKDSGGKGCGFY